MSINQLVERFVQYIIEHSDNYTELDRIYLRNKVLGLVGVSNFSYESIEYEHENVPILVVMDKLIHQAIQKGQIKDQVESIEQLEASLMDLLTPSPSKVNQLFYEYYQKSPNQATNYFYQLSKENNYIKTREIKQNICFQVMTDYGELEVTINLSKPEKDPKKIAKAAKKVNLEYPRCLLCIENEGYIGRINYPARANHRVIRLPLLDEQWGMQYSPYAYYREHAIIFSMEHRSMKINQTTFQRLIEIVSKFPHYFVGSNADLPIVGGSILTHEHYQAGNYVFPMERAPIEQMYNYTEFPKVTVGIVKWPTSVIRLISTDEQQLVALATKFLSKWQYYDNEKLGIFSHTPEGKSSHTVTPIARKQGGSFILDIAFRDNTTTDEFPDGVFHPHADVQHIKKENIGLIELMGLAILPPRLAKELTEVEKYLLDESNEIAQIHRMWTDNIKKNHLITEENVQKIVHSEVGKVFLRVLEDTGVFKRNQVGQKAFHQFMKTIE